MKIGCIGLGAWGFSLAIHLAKNCDHQILAWSSRQNLIDMLNANKVHPNYPNIDIPANLKFTSDLKKIINDSEIIVEAVTASGIRSIFEQLKSLGLTAPKIIICTSKGIEQDTGKILPEVIVDVLGESFRDRVGAISGPSFADEVMQGLPTSVVATGFYGDTITEICQIFNNDSLRVYPNSDILGVCIGGALKNVIAIACGISEGLKLGSSCRAALITRGLHEIDKILQKLGCNPKTLYGLSGMGDLTLTCSSLLSRNFTFGKLLAEGMKVEEAREKVGKVVEGAYTLISAMNLARKYEIEMPITTAVYKIMHHNLSPKDAVMHLMQRTINKEHL